METKTLQPFLEAVVEAFGALLNQGLKTGRPFARPDDLTAHELTVIVTFSGRIRGFVALSFPEAVARNTFESDWVDGVGELVNIVAGNAKRSFPDYHPAISLPRRVTGRGRPMELQGFPLGVRVSLSSPLGDFAMDVSLSAD